MLKSPISSSLFSGCKDLECSLWKTVNCHFLLIIFPHVPIGLVGPLKEFSQIMKPLDKQLYPSKWALNSQDFKNTKYYLTSRAGCVFVYVHFYISQSDLPL